MYRTRCSHTSIQLESIGRECACDPFPSGMLRLEDEAAAAETISSLAVCVCEISQSRPLDLTRNLQKYKNLKELILHVPFLSLSVIVCFISSLAFAITFFIF